MDEQEARSIGQRAKNAEFGTLDSQFLLPDSMLLCSMPEKISVDLCYEVSEDQRTIFPISTDCGS